MDPDLFVTVDHRLLAAREKLGLAEIVTPSEALSIIGPWSRAVDKAFIGLIGLNRGFYYWALGRALIPSFHPVWASLVELHHRVPEGEQLMSLGQSIMSRIAGLTRRLDQMVMLWQLPTNNDRVDELADYFDSCVLEANAVLDTLARLIGTYLRVSLKKLKIGP